MLAAIALIAMVIGVSRVSPRAAAKVFDGDVATQDESNQSGQDRRIREGTPLEKVAGHFKLTGDRVTFFATGGKQRFGGLENLALERIARIVKDSPTQLQWSVTGVITEYRGTNYVLVTHAVLANETKGYSQR